MKTSKDEIDITKQPYWVYATDVVSGKIVACENVRNACKRFINDLDRDDLEFRKETADRAISFIGILRHFRGKSSGKPFILEPFQTFIVANLTGWYWKETGDRRFTSAYIEMARKGGKTALIASLAMYYFIADGEDGAEVDIAANNFEQAKICFEFIQQYCKQLDPQQRDLKVYRSSIELPCTASKINVFSADASGKDGFNASVGIIDEYHSAKTTGMRDIIKSSMGMRRDPMLLTITSAGFDKSLPCYQLRTTCIEILSGLKTDDSTFAIIYGLDEGDDWTDEKVWIKSNPNLERTVTTKYLREQVTSAINNPTEEVSVRTKNLGQWLSTSSVWIPDTYINKCTKTINLDDFNEDSECWVGVDLASVGDMTAVTFMLFKEDDPTPYFTTKYYLPETALVESPNRELYKYWVRTKQLTITAGNCTDYDYITNDIMAMYNRFNVRKIAYDNWNSTSWAIKATELGLPLEPYSQSIGNFNKPTREFERLIRQGKCVIDNNEITRWMFRNVAIKTDTNGNIKPNKGAGAEKKIDGIISQITALGKWLETPRFSGSILAL